MNERRTLDNVILATAIVAVLLALGLDILLTDPDLGPDPDKVMTPPQGADSPLLLLFSLLLALPFLFLLRLVWRHVLVQIDRPAARWGLLSVISLVFGSFAILVFLATIGESASRRLHLGESDRYLVLLSAQAAAELLGLLLLFGLIRFHHQGPSALGLQRPGAIRMILGGTLAWICFAPAFFLIALGVNWLRSVSGLPPDPQDIVRLLQDMETGGVHYGLLAATCLSAVIMAPIYEEILFRGFLYGWLRSHLRPIPAAVLCAALFTIVHSPITVWPPIFALGLFLTFAYERTGNLWTSIAIHFVHNTAVVAVLLTQVFLVTSPS